VSITALSAVGAAFPAGAAVVCAPTPELNARTPASAAIAISDPIPRPIAISFFQTFDHACGIIADGKHRKLAPDVNRKSIARLVPANVKQLTSADGFWRYP
jgi:hypothetical protein